MPNKTAKSGKAESPPKPKDSKGKDGESWVWTQYLFQWSDLMIAAWKAGHLTDRMREIGDS